MHQITLTPQFGVELAGSGRGRRLAANEAARAVLAQPGDLTQAQRAALMAYSGLGGVGESKDQYYTPASLAAFVWQVLARTGITEGQVLEPSCGTGVFLHTAPAGYQLTGVELDETAAAIAGRLWPEAEIHAQAFEAFAIAAEKAGRRFDAVIGNVPFGARGASIRLDRAYRAYRRQECYFLVRALDLVHPGGVVALIVPGGIVDNSSLTAFRKTLLGKAEFLGAFRFTDEAFKSTGARVVTDLIVLRRGPGGPLDQAFLSQAYFVGPGRHYLIGEGATYPSWGSPTVTGAITPELLGRALAHWQPEQRRPEPEQAATPAPEPAVPAVVINDSLLRFARSTGTLIQTLITAQTHGDPDVEGLRSAARETVEIFLKTACHPQALAAHAEDPAIGQLIAAVHPEGQLADILTRTTHHSHHATPLPEDLAALAAELARQSPDGGFTLGQLQAAYEGPPVTLPELAARFDADPAYAVSNGLYQPMARYASGPVYDKRDALMLAFASTTEGPRRQKLQQQMQALKAVLKHTPLSDARLSLRDTWIPDAIKNEFLDWNDKGQAEWARYGHLAWQAEQGVYITVTSNPRAALLGKHLNHQGLGGRESENRRRQHEIEEIETAFREWTLASRHAPELEEQYNRRFNNYVAPAYSTEPLEIPGFVAPPGQPLHGYQCQTVRKMLDLGRGCIALDVGLGKTRAAIALNLLLKAQGLARKPAIVVPKSVLANWKAEADLVAPEAKILYIGENFREDGTSATMTASQREHALKQAAQNDWDLILCSDSAFQMVPLSPEVLQEFADTDFWDQVYGRKLTDFQRAQLRARHETTVALRQFLNVSEQIFFDDLGIDSLTLDEAHSVKNLAGSKQGSRIRYLPIGDGAKRAHDFRAKAAFIRARNGNRGVFQLTATPTKNSPLEVYAQICHLAPEEWTSRGIYNIEHFIDQYGRIEPRQIQNTAGKYEDVQALVGFRNLNNLRDILFKYTDLRSAVEVGLPLPASSQQVLLSELDADQKLAYEHLRVRAARQVAEEGESPHVFAIMHEMEVVAFCPQLIHPLSYAADYISPKMQQVCETVADLLSAGAGGQIIFTSDKFVAAHAQIKACLVLLGVPEDKICIINGETAPKSSDRQRLANGFNSGDYIVAIGNDGIIGQGVNLQADTAGIHHASLPWTTPDIIQRNGRGLRQGNRQAHVGLYTYFAKGSFDGIRHDALTRKGDWIGELWRGKGDDYLNLEADTRGGIDPGELQILLSPDPDEARARWEANQALALKAYHAKKKVVAYQTYQRWYRNQQLVHKLGPDEPGAQKLAQQLEAIAEELQASEYFTHKFLLDDYQTRLRNGSPMGSDVLIHFDLMQVFVGGDYVKAWIDGQTGREPLHMQVGSISQRCRTIRFDLLEKQGYSNFRDWNMTQIFKANVEVLPGRPELPPAEQAA